MPVKELCRKHGFSDAAFYGWRTKFGGLQVNEPKRLRDLEAENAKIEEAAGAPGYRGAEGRLRGKALAPQAKRQAVLKMRQELTISERRACGLVGLSRTTLRRVLAEENPRPHRCGPASSTSHTPGAASAIDASMIYYAGRASMRTIRKSIGCIVRRRSAWVNAVGASS